MSHEPPETSPADDDDVKRDEPTESLEPPQSEDAEHPQNPPPCPHRIGRYRVDGILGKGGFGTVYLGFDDQLQRHVAIKVPRPELTSRPADVEAYLAEARVLAQLDHQHIVPVHDVGSSAEFPCFFVSKHIDGTSLAKRMRGSQMSASEAANLIATIADALQYAHRRGLVHRDIKPGNILIDREGKPYVVDFGLALKEADLGRGPRYAGTPAYMSPEQARGEGHRVDGRSDIYSLGAVLYELLTGRRTFTSEKREELLTLIATQEPKPPRQIDDRIPKELERICLKALSKRASDRYTTAKDMTEDLREFVGGHKIQATARSSEPRGAQGGQPEPPSPTPRGDSSTVDSDSRPIRVVPKGLRAFDEHDADFFLELLPGPRDRNGLPDSIRFWKARTEEVDPDKTFSVGVLYGPSGCGKSSLVKAGLLPRLSKNIVAVYVECTGQDTELRQLNALRRQCPTLPADLDLKETLAAIRRGRGIPFGKKVLIVLDQFEQWLHARKDGEDAELVNALRQCDGSQVQCVLMVRDDFWLGVSRFMQELEISLIEGQNSALVDLFDVDHATKVLTTFGWAYGHLPDRPAEMSNDQGTFVKRAVAELAQGGKIVCLRLALFAQMMKDKTWVPSTLNQVGGTEGLGVTFLEETFSASTSPPRHRYHQKAARGVLKALLPEPGLNIRGHVRSHDDLLEACEYAGRREEFDELLSILDSELRLVTPTDPAHLDPGADAELDNQSGQQHYQLTHDYLIPSLREWLTRQQKETRRGRAELRLAERSALWNDKPEHRHLPSWWEYLSIRLLTAPKDWTGPQRQMMTLARRFHALRWGSALLVALIAAIAVQWMFINYQRKDLSRQIKAAVTAMANSRGILVPRDITDLEQFPSEDVFKELRAQFGQTGKPTLAYALAHFGDPSVVDFLVSQIKSASKDEVDNLATALGHAPQRAENAIQAAAVQNEDDIAYKARLAISALHLDNTSVAQDMCELRSDPVQRTLLIETLPQWHGDAARLAAVVDNGSDSPLRSCIILGIGALPAEELTAEVKLAWQPVLLNWYEKDTDAGVHGAAGWALRQWRVPLPEIPTSREAEKGRQWYINSVGMTMVCIPEGKFSRLDKLVVLVQDGKPQEVRLTRPFFLSDREVSVALFERFMEDSDYPLEKPKDWKGPNKQISPTPNHPVQQTNWNDAVMFCNWLSQNEELAPWYEYGGKEIRLRAGGTVEVDSWNIVPEASGYRLPTEAEWEYACRAGTASDYTFGNDESQLSKYAVFSTIQAQPCGSKLPNAWGLFDMHGNVWEWCRDWHGTYPEESSLADPLGQHRGKWRVMRGGSWFDAARCCRSEFRGTGDRSVNRSQITGFRVARSLSGT